VQVWVYQIELKKGIVMVVYTLFMRRVLYIVRIVWDRILCGVVFLMENEEVYNAVQLDNDIVKAVWNRNLCRCVYQIEDEEGYTAVQLNKDIVTVAAKALEKNLTILAPLVLPYTEQFR